MLDRIVVRSFEVLTILIYGAAIFTTDGIMGKLIMVAFAGPPALLMAIIITLALAAPFLILREMLS